MKGQKVAFNAKQYMAFQAFRLIISALLLHGPARVADVDPESRDIDFVGDSQAGAAIGGFFGQI
jgi:hypothetical protein